MADIYKDHVSFRQYLVDDLVRKLFGPTRNASLEVKRETLNIPPLQVYSTGVLFPQKLIQNKLEDTPEDEVNGASDDDEELEPGHTDLANSKKSNINEDAPGSNATEPLNLANEFSPAAAGISFRLKKPTTLMIDVSFGTYERTKIQEPNPKAGKVSMDGSVEPEFRDATGYRRHNHEPDAIPVKISGTTKKHDPIQVSEIAPHLKLHVVSRLRKKDSSIVVSAMLVNSKISSDEKFSADTSDCFFQVEMSVSAKNGEAVFMPIDRAGGGSDDEELKSLDLLYRHRRAFALGHGVSGDWNRDEKLSEQEAVNYVRTASVPTYELKPIRPRESGFGDSLINLRMGYLSGGDWSKRESKEKIIGSLRALANDYMEWIISIEEQSETLTRAQRDAASKHIANCKDCHRRIEEGIEKLESDQQAFESFSLMNRAMLMQQIHSSLPQRDLETDYPVPPEAEGKERAWRPFQLAFVLMNIQGMTDNAHADRKIVDLIWFPTGGGKTEAYLGLAAFTILYERMHGRAHGTTVIMRYTLRLLTAQQFQRAAALILALETLRRNYPSPGGLGEEEISIGLWVGESLSPNKRKEAVDALNKLKRERFAKNPFQVLYCPWCGAKLSDPTNLGYHKHNLDNGSKTVRISCTDAKCDFSTKRCGLPIYVIDDDLYDAPPTLLIGTVDKFAQISWKDEAGSFFGVRDNGIPPVLIIQDELHLISGPLGTMVGLYETAIDRLCSRDGCVHKVVASTATIRRAEKQCLDLYARETNEFPAQGVRAGDSYFAYEDNDSPGRLYVGVMGSAVKSHQTALVRTCSPLLQAVRYDDKSDSEDEDLKTESERKSNIVDPYGTLVWYFNSLRELGHAATLCTGDIPEHLKSMCSRLQIPYEMRRYIREIVELTSRRNADEIPDILSNLETPWKNKPQRKSPIDVLLATNMISVGVDVPRLGLIVMSGQPKSASEYIQATSRVGRSHPGLVVTVYTQTKSRDRSHYERFVAYHQSIYRYVEPTSVTPFSPQARERGMRGLLVALARQLVKVNRPNEVDQYQAELLSEIEYILSRVELLDPDERDDAEEELSDWLTHWQDYKPQEYGRMGGKVDTATLAYPFGSAPDPDHQEQAWPLMTSMRNVDGTCTARVLNIYQNDAEEECEVED